MTLLKTIVITGASSGIGAALAAYYADPGVTLGLMGRNTERLKEISLLCQAKQASVQIACIDICDSAAMSEWLIAFDTKQPVDLVIANAGISAGVGGQIESEDQVRQIFAVNVDGVLNTILPLTSRMQSRKSGQIAIMSSLASIRSLPSCPAYSASKAAVRYFGEALRGVMKDHGVTVSVICPGYIKTPLTDTNSFPMPLLMSAEKAAIIIGNALAKRKTRIIFPLALYWPLRLLTCLPTFLTNFFFDRLPRKGEMKQSL